MDDFVLEIVELINKAYEKKDLDIKPVIEEDIDIDKEYQLNLNEELKHYHEKDIADAYLELDHDKQEFLRESLDDQFLSDIFAYFTEENIEEAIEDLSNEEIADIVELMDADDAIDILEELDHDKQDEIMELIEGEIKEDIKLIDSFSEDEIGSLMTTNYIDINSTLPVKKAMKRVVEMAKENDNVKTLIAVDNDNVYLGTIDLIDLIKARVNTPIDTIIRQNTPYLHANDLIVDVTETIIDYNLDMLPVLDNENHLLGVITSSDVVQLVDDTLTEDYAKLAGMSEEDDLDEPLFSSVKKRIPWLIILVILGILVSMLISLFENVVATITTIMFFQSLVLDMAGNVGTQSLAVTVRVISDKEVSKKDQAKLIFKEIRIGFFNGLCLGLLSLIFVFSFLWISKTVIIEGNGFNLLDCFKTSGTISIALVTAMTVSSLFGTIVPITLKKCKVDPAAASGPFITTLNDCIAVLCYYGLAMLMFMSILF